MSACARPSRSRARTWELGAAPKRAVLDFDAALIEAFSRKQGAKGTFKKGFGHHPLLWYVDGTREGSRRTDRGATSPDRPSRRVGASAHARQERGPRSHDALPARPPAGVRPVRQEGRAWLAAQQLAVTEDETVARCLRQIDFLGAEIAAIDAKLAEFALASTDVKRLMTMHPDRGDRRYPPL